MKKFFLYIQLLVCGLFAARELRSQELILRPRVYIEAYGGGSKYFGEFSDISFWISGGMNIWYRFNPSIYFGGSVAIGQTRFRVVNDAKNFFPAPQMLARVTPIDGLLRWNMLPFESGTPYITLGAGWMSYEVHEDDGQYSTFYAFNENTKVKTVHPLNGASLKSTFEYNLGLGYEHSLSNRFTIGAYGRMYFPFTDLLDAVEYTGSANDAFLLFGLTASVGITSLTGMADTDSDGVPDQMEDVLGMNINKSDSDGDGLSDLDELTHHCDPLAPDTDKDGLSDYDEVERYQTSPLLTDSDSDGLSDEAEIAQNTNPNSPDSDADTISDAAEIALGTDPNSYTELSEELVEVTEAKTLNGTEVRVIRPMLAEIKALRSQLAHAQGELRTKNAEMEKKIASQNAAKNRTTQTLQSAQNTVAEIQRRYDSLQKELALLARKNYEQQPRIETRPDTILLASIKATVDSLENKISSYQATIASLRSEIANRPATREKEIFVHDTIVRAYRDTVFTVRLDTVVIERRDTVLLASDTGGASSVTRRDSFAISTYTFDPEPIYFPFGGSEITPEGEQTIQAIADFMHKYPESILEISGYADLDGTLEQNKIMSQKRTGAVAQRLQEKGIDPWRLILRAYGSILATKSDHKDRRVEFKLVKLVRF